MRPVVLVALTLALLPACKPKAPVGDPELLSEVKTRLAEREKKVSSYSIAGTISQDSQQAPFEFTLRGGRMRGELLGENGRTFSYDGDHLFELVPSEKKLTTWRLQLPEPQGRVYLTQLFASFVPEGFRAPLLDFSRAVAVRTSRPNAPEAVEVSSETKDESGGRIRVSYVYRLPAMDLLERRLEAPAATMVIAVEAEHCEKALGLCLPKRLVQRIGEATGAVTELHKVELNPAVPLEAFTVTLPEGFTQVTSALPGAGG